MLPPTTTMTVEQALHSALHDAPDLDEVLVMGYFKTGEFFVRSSRLNRRDALWLAERLKRWALEGS